MGNGKERTLHVVVCKPESLHFLVFVISTGYFLFLNSVKT